MAFVRHRHLPSDYVTTISLRRYRATVSLAVAGEDENRFSISDQNLPIRHYFQHNGRPDTVAT